MKNEKTSKVEKMISEGEIKRRISWREDGKLKGITFWYNSSSVYIASSEAYSSKIIKKYLISVSK